MALPSITLHAMGDDFVTPIGKLLSHYMIDHGISRNELARRAGYSTKTIDMLLHKEGMPKTLHIYYDIKTALGLNLEEGRALMELVVIKWLKTHGPKLWRNFPPSIHV